MKTKSLFLILFILCGCTTVEFVRKDFTPTKQAVLRYAPPSDSKDEAKYREEINKKAGEFCGGGFQITKEYQARDASDSSVGVGTGFGTRSSSLFLGSTTPNTSMYNFVEIICK
ncbi:MAG: hypothetical protein ACXVAX_04480 [Pseudobdellovibrio sp.]